MSRVVLIVDDDAGIRDVCKAFLSREYAILEAGDGLNALQLCQSVKVDVLLTDIVMPGMTGIELVKRVRMLKLGIRIVCMSGYLPDGDPIPFAKFLHKPFTPLDLLSMVRSSIDELEI